MSAPALSASALLLAKAKEQRRITVTLPDGRRIHLQRAPQVRARQLAAQHELAAMYRQHALKAGATPEQAEVAEQRAILDLLLPEVIKAAEGWEGWAEHHILPTGIGSDATAEFSTELFEFVIADDAAAAERCIKAYIAALRETLSALERAQGN